MEYFFAEFEKGRRKSRSSFESRVIIFRVRWFRSVSSLFAFSSAIILRGEELIRFADEQSYDAYCTIQTKFKCWKYRLKETEIRSFYSERFARPMKSLKNPQSFLPIQSSILYTSCYSREEFRFETIPFRRIYIYKGIYIFREEKSFKSFRLAVALTSTGWYHSRKSLCLFPPVWVSMLSFSLPTRHDCTIVVWARFGKNDRLLRISLPPFSIRFTSSRRKKSCM